MQPTRLVKAAVPLVSHALETAKANGDQETIRACEEWLVAVAVKKPKPKQRSLTLEPAVLVFPCNGPIQEWNLTQRLIDEWSEFFPGVDVLTECRKAAAWCRVNAAKRKTASGMPRFLIRWLSRVQDERPRNGTHQPIARESTAEARQRANQAASEEFLRRCGVQSGNGRALLLEADGDIHGR